MNENKDPKFTIETSEGFTKICNITICASLETNFSSPDILLFEYIKKQESKLKKEIKKN